MKKSGLVAAGTDVLSFFNVPGSNLLKEAIDQRKEQKRKEAFEVLLDTISNGGEDLALPPEEKDEFVDMVIRLLAAVDRGAAKRNLRLLTKIMVGLKKNRLFLSSNFERWANVLETLTRDELLVLAAGIKAMEREGHSWSLMKDALVPKTFSSLGELEIVCAPLLRTGLLLPTPTIGGMSYHPTDGLRELGKLASLEQLD